MRVCAHTRVVWRALFLRSHDMENMKKTLQIFEENKAISGRLLGCLCVLLALVAFSLRASAQAPAQAPANTTISDEECEFMRDYLNYTDYYCECLNHGLSFHYGMDTLIQGVNWYTATLNQVAAGFSAYWFSSSSITIEGYVSCGQDTATLRQVVGANRAYHADIQTLMNKLGGSSSALSGIPLHVRTTQPDDKFGRLVITPYDKGPHSTCEDPFPVSWNNPYVISDPDNVYMMAPTTPAVSGQFIRWVCPRGDSVRVTITRKTCDGEPILEHTLTDSLHVWMLPYDTLLSAKRANDSLYFHFYTSAKIGEAYFYRAPEILTDTVDTTTCLGAILSFNEMQFTSDTMFSDTIYFAYDSVNYKRQLKATTFNLHFLTPEVEYDTINCHADSLGFYYLGLRTQQINRFGDFSVYYNRVGECQRDIRLHVEEILYPQEITIDTTMCQGRRLRINGVNYTKDTVFTITTMQGKQEIITTYYLHFTAPELQEETIWCHADSLPFYYRGKSNLKISNFGTQTLTITDPTYQTCTEKVKLTVKQLWYEQNIDVDTVLCQGGRFGMSGAIKQNDTLYLVNTQDKTTKFHTYYHITYSAPELEYDSLLLHISRMPYNYYGTLIPSYGDTTVLVHQSGQCDRLVALHVEEYIYPITYDSVRIDTTFCDGMSFRLHDSIYTETTQFVDTFWTSEYSVLYTMCSIHVVPTIEEYDTVLVLASSLPYVYEGQEFTTFGSHVVELHEEGLCDRRIFLNMKELVVVYDTVTIDTTICSGKYLSVADTLVFAATSFTRSVWSQKKDSCSTTKYNVYFAPPVEHFDTIRAYYSELPYHYDAFPGGKNLSNFGDYSYNYNPVNDCKQVFNVRLVQIWSRDTVVNNDTVCAGGVERHSTVQIPQSIRQADSVHLIIYNTYVKEPVMYYDTITVSTDSLPIAYQSAYSQTTSLISAAGDYDLVLTDESGCQIIAKVHVVAKEPNSDDAVENVCGKEKYVARKFVEDGRLYIEYHGVVYDVTGRKK